MHKFIQAKHKWPIFIQHVKKCYFALVRFDSVLFVCLFFFLFFSSFKIFQSKKNDQLKLSDGIVIKCYVHNSLILYYLQREKKKTSFKKKIKSGKWIGKTEYNFCNTEKKNIISLYDLVCGIDKHLNLWNGKLLSNLFDKTIKWWVQFFFFVSWIQIFFLFMLRTRLRIGCFFFFSPVQPRHRSKLKSHW